MSESSQWQRVCVVCVRHPHDDGDDCGPRCRQVELEAGHVCTRCANRLRDNLAALPEIAAAALDQTTPGTNGGGVLGSADPRRAPIDLDAADPTGLLVRLEPSDPSTEVTILEALEGWERVVREDRGLAAFGPASLARSRRGDTDRPGQVTLAGTCGFLRSQLDWITTEPEFDVRGFAQLVARCRAALARWDAAAADRAGWRVPCPTTTDDGECGRVLIVRDIGEGADVVWCRGCGRGWEPRRLVLVAGRDADVWVDGEAITAWTGIPLRTVQRWAKSGAVRHFRGQFALRDVRETAAQYGRAAEA